MDESMAAQEHVALARSLLDMYNNRQSDRAWLEKSLAAFAADFEVYDVPSGTTLHGPDGLKRLLLFFVESFPHMRAELINAFATEDQVILQGTWRWNNTGTLYLPSEALPLMGRSGKLRCYFVLQIRKEKIAGLHAYYDMMTLMKQLVLVPAWEQATE
jgi:predicted ester cyclase